MWPERNMGPYTSPTTYSSCVSQQGCLTWSEEAAATWEISGSCGKLAVGDRPLSPTLPRLGTAFTI